MKKSKIIFFIIAAIFIVITILFAIDIFSKTTPPWEKRGETIQKYKVQ